MRNFDDGSSTKRIHQSHYSKSVFNYPWNLGVACTTTVAMASVSGYQVTVKTANGTVEDLTIDCPGEWCVFDIKTHVVDNHPLHPVRK